MDAAIRAEETPPEMRPSEVVWREEAPVGKLDLLVSLDFRMTSTGLFSDILLPAATWYEKYDLSSTDMHPFVHAFNAAIAPPWETRSDYDTFVAMSKEFSRHAARHLGVRHDLVSVPLQHDTPGETSQPGGRVLDWLNGDCEPIPGKTMPTVVVVERDYAAVGDMMTALGPNVERLGTSVKGVTLKPAGEVDYLRRVNGAVQGGVADGRPSLARAEQACEAILALSGTTNGRIATAGFKELERRVGKQLSDLASDNEGKRITFADTQSRPQQVITSHEWSGSEHGGRRYSPFTINVERLKPWHTLTGRQHFFLDHDWMTELGEQLPTYRPRIGVKDNDWIESYNRNGVVVARAIVSNRMPEGTVYMYHAKDRTIDVPISEVSGKRGGIHNSLTRLLIKPSHLIGGYAQFSYGFNYYGPTGNQRDEITVIRRRSQEVEY